MPMRTRGCRATIIDDADIGYCTTALLRQKRSELPDETDGVASFQVTL